MAEFIGIHIYIIKIYYQTIFIILKYKAIAIEYS